LGYVDQSRDSLNPNATVWHEISGGNDIVTLGKREMNSRAYVGAFNFKGGDQQQKVGTLSGGQRNRVHLAKMLKCGANVLLLDRLATHILAYEGNSHVEWFEGNFQEYERDKAMRLGEDSLMPSRNKYKKFER
jgi:ATPase subunit of ABC transporter with duplicated ATPase domains